MSRSRATVVGSVGSMAYSSSSGLAPRVWFVKRSVQIFAVRRLGRIDGVQLFERLDRLVVVAEALDPDIGDAPQQAHLLRRILGDVGGALQDADELGPARQLPV